MRSVVLLSFFLLAATACSMEPQYKDSAEFEAAVKSWNLNGKTEHEAISFLTQKRFTCRDRTCNLDVKGFPCNQKLQISLDINKGVVTGAEIRKLANGELPAVCL